MEVFNKSYKIRQSQWRFNPLRVFIKHAPEQYDAMIAFIFLNLLVYTSPRLGRLTAWSFCSGTICRRAAGVQ